MEETTSVKHGVSEEGFDLYSGADPKKPVDVLFLQEAYTDNEIEVDWCLWWTDWTVSQD